MDNHAPLLDAIGRILRDRFAEVERSVRASRITRMECVRPGVCLLVFGDGTTQELQIPAGPEGAQGERGLPGERGADGPRGPMGADGARGERGERGAEGVGIDGVEQEVDAPHAFTLRMSNGEAVEVLLPTGPAGEQGERGEPGLDRFIAAPRHVRDGEAIAKNDLIAWGGGIVQAVRATTHTPDVDPASFVCVVAGVESLAMVENIETRTYDLTARLTNGTEQVVRLRALPRHLGDGPRPGEAIIKGDSFVRGDWLYTATQDGANPEQIEAGGWRRQNVRGKRGEDGERGARGEPGVGIADVAMEEPGILSVRLTTGEEKFLDVRAPAQVAA